MQHVETSPVLAEDQLEALIASAGVDVTRSIVDALILSNDQLMTALHEGFSQGDLTAIANTAHAIKGSSANLGAVLVAERARQIERASKEGNIANAQAAFNQMSADLTLTSAALINFFVSKAA